MEIKKIKKKVIIFTDLDETLLKENKFNHKILNNFIKTLLKKEYEIIPLTSKTYLEVMDLLKQIKFKLPFSVENGAAYYIPAKDKHNYQYKKILNPYALKRENIKKIFKENPFKKYLNNIEFIENLPFLKIKKITKLNYNQLENFKSREYTVPILWKGDKRLKNEFKTTLLKYNLKITFGGKLFNISGLHSKVDSMYFFTNQYKVKYRTRKLITTSLGDSQNDIEILNNSNYSGIIRGNSDNIFNLYKKNNIFRSFTRAPNGWVEVLKKILIKMEKDYN